MNKKELKRNGFIDIGANPKNKKAFLKIVKNAKGIKYAMNLSFWEFPNGGEAETCNVKVQMKRGNEFFKIQLFTNPQVRTVQDIEDLCEEIWMNMYMEYLRTI